jgi:hypothetical protein
MPDRIRIGDYLEAELQPEQLGFKTHKWNIYSRSSGDLLGDVMWYRSWRQYTFTPVYGATFNSSCLLALYDFLKECTLSQRQGK